MATMDKENGVCNENAFKKNSGPACLLFSPPAKIAHKKEDLKSLKQNEKIADRALICAKFQHALWIEFGNVDTKSSNVMTFQLQNPSTTKAVTVEIDSKHEKSGISITLGSNNGDSVIVPPSGKEVGTVYWTPMHDSSIREAVKLKMDKKAPLQLTVHGIAGTGKNESVSNNSALVLTERRANMKRPQSMKRMSAVTDSRLNYRNLEVNRNRRASSVSAFPEIDDSSVAGTTVTQAAGGKSVVTNDSRKSLLHKTTQNGSAPLQTKKIAHAAYHDGFAQKQTKSYADWINFTFAQAQVINVSNSNHDDDNDSQGGRTIVSTAGQLLVQESEARAQGLKELSQRRVEAKVRQDGLALSRSEPVRLVLQSLHEEVKEGRLLMRSDRDLHADLGLQNSLLELLYCYESSWLRLGLEVVFGEIITLPKTQPQPQNSSTSSSKKNSNKSTAATGKAAPVAASSEADTRWKSVVRAFVHEFLLNDQSIAERFDKQKLLYVAQQKKMKEMLRRHALKKFLSLVVFLDVARDSSLLPKPCLFHTKAAHKTSKSIVIAFCRDFLRGEGDILRHLALLGCQMKFEQSYVDEFDFSLKNLATDLRDGVRLTRLIELLTHTKDLSVQLRVPAVSRLQKLHNVGLVLNRLYRPTDDKPEAKHIVDGHRDMTFMLLWKMLYTYDLRMVTSPARVHEEIRAIRHTASWRQSVYGAEELEGMAVRVPTRLSDGSVVMPQITASAAAAAAGDDNDDNVSLLSSTESVLDDKSLGSALLEWCQTIVERYDVPVYDLSSCLADGRALCLLIHYYHPSILPTKHIKKTTAHLMEESLGTAMMAEESAATVGAADATADATADADATTTVDPRLDAFTELGPGVTSEASAKAIQGERRNYWTLKKACNGIGGIPFILPEMDSRNPPEERTMVVFLGYLFARLVESSAQVRASIRIQRFVRAHACKFSKRETIAATTGTGASVGADLESVAASASVVAAAAAAAEGSGVTAVADDIDDSATVSSIGTEVTHIKKRDEDRALKTLQNLPVTIQICPHHAATLIKRQLKTYCIRKQYIRLRSDNNMSENQQLEGTTTAGVVEAEEELPPEAEVVPESAIDEKGEEEQEGAAVVVENSHAIVPELNNDATMICSLEVQHIVDNALNLHMQKSLKEALDVQLEKERRILVAAEMKLALESKSRVEEAEALRAMEEQKAHALTAAATQLAREESARRAAVEEAEQQLREEAERKIQQESAARAAVEQQLQELQALRLRDQEAVAAAEQEKQQRELAWQAAQEQLAVEQSEREAADIARREAEVQARNAVEEAAEVERQARCMAEQKVAEERAAREAAEAKLQALEDARRIAEETALRAQAEAARIEEERHEASVRVQAVWRGYSICRRRSQMMHLVLRLQSIHRGNVARKQARIAMLAVLIVQSLWRRYLCKKALVVRTQRTILVQSVWRMYQGKKASNMRRSAGIVIATRWRTALTRRHFLQVRHSVTCIQSVTRRRIEQRYFAQQKIKILRVQSVVRRRIAVKTACIKKTALAKLQKAMQFAIDAKREQAACNESIRIEKITDLQRRRSSRAIGSFINHVAHQRKHERAANCIQRWYISRLPLIRARKLNRGFRRLQAVHIAQRVRKRSRPAIAAIRNRIREATRRAIADPSLRIGKQTANALHTLQTGKMISQLLKACQTLQLSTQISRYCCEAFAQAGAASVLFALLRSCNRSTPHQELLRMALVVLLNVGRQPDLASVLGDAPDSTDALVDLMQMFRDKKSIFLLATELLARMVDANENTKALCNQPAYRKRLEGIVHIIERKHRLEMRVRSVGHSATTTTVSTMVAASSPAVGAVGGEFDQYKGKAYANIEPIHCIKHLMELLVV